MIIITYYNYFFRRYISLSDFLMTIIIKGDNEADDKHNSRSKLIFRTSLLINGA